MILCGFFTPNKVEQQPNFDPKMRINYGFIHIHPETIRKRLLKRDWSEEKIQYHLEWANYIEEDTRKKKEQFMVSGDKNSPEKVAAIFEKWISSYLQKQENDIQ